MSLANRLYDRPMLHQRFGKLALYVSGELPGAAIAAAYEGRLPIHNAIGACSVELLSGVLPAGGQVYVDNTTSEIVVAWPAYTESPLPLQNAGFETGDLTGWTYTTIGGSGTLLVTNIRHNSGAYSAYWLGGKGLGSEGGIECLALNNTACVAYPGQTINFRSTILYNPDGGTPKGSRGQTRLHWYDEAGDLIDVSYGELIKTRAHNGVWTDSAGSGVGPPGTASARLAVWLTATGAGHSYADDATWDAPTAVGINTNATVCLQLRVHDAGGRAADWSGCVSISGMGAQLSDWKYKQVAADDGTDYSAAEFDDSAWGVGTAPFGSYSSGGATGTPDPHAYDPRFAVDFATTWTAFTRLWMRRTLTLSSVPAGGYSMVSFIEDNCHVYVNGVLVLDSPDNPTGGSGITTAIAADKFVVGVNSIAVRCDDEADAGSVSLVYADFLLDVVT